MPTATAPPRRNRLTLMLLAAVLVIPLGASVAAERAPATAAAPPAADTTPQTEVQRLRDENAALNASLARLRERLPASEGGSLTAAEARSRAAADASTLTRLLEQGRGIDNPSLWRQVRSAENDLHRSQFLLARADGARTVYRVRPGDSLEQISWLFYGDDQQWSAIFDANRHVITEPSQLPPGLTLVIP